MLTLRDFPNARAFSAYVLSLTRDQVRQATPTEYARLRQDLVRAEAQQQITDRDSRDVARHSPKDKP